MKLGPLLKTARMKRGLTLRQVTALSGIAFGRMCEFETGVQVNLTVKTVARLAGVLGIPAAAITDACIETLRVNGDL